MKKLLLPIAVVGLFMLGLSGCGLSPQQLYPEPRITGQLERVANGQTVSVAVDDQRTTSVIGHRGGLYAESNTLTVEGRTTFPRLQAETEAALRMRGFIPVPQGQAGSQLRLSIADLKYSVVEDRTVASKVQLTAVLAVEVHKEGQVYRGRYTANLDKGFVKPPTDSANNRLISWVMSDALERVFKDKGLLQFMANQ